MGAARAASKVFMSIFFAFGASRFLAGRLLSPERRDDAHERQREKPEPIPFHLIPYNDIVRRNVAESL